MRVEVLLVANQAAVENGLLSVIGAGWETISPGLLPATIQATIAGIIILDEHEIGQTPVALLRVKDQAGHVAGSQASMVVSGVRATTPGVPMRMPFASQVTFVAYHPTVVEVEVVVDGHVIGSSSFAVLDPIPDHPPAA